MFWKAYEAINEAAVIGVPDDDFGERVVAVVAPVQNATDISSDEIVRFCKDRLAGYKCPKEVFFIDQLPRNAMGKLQKNVLAEKYGKKT